MSQHALGCIHEDHRHISGGSAGDHVAGVLFVARGVGHDEFTSIGAKKPVGHINGDALLAFGSQTIHQQGKVDITTLGALLLGVFLQSRHLILKNQLGFVEHAAN